MLFRNYKVVWHRNSFLKNYGLDDSNSVVFNSFCVRWRASIWGSPTIQRLNALCISSSCIVVHAKVANILATPNQSIECCLSSLYLCSIEHNLSTSTANENRLCSKLMLLHNKRIREVDVFFYQEWLKNEHYKRKEWSIRERIRARKKVYKRQIIKSD